LADAEYAVDQEFLTKACQLPVEVADTYTVASKYYDGVHSTRLTDRARRYLTRSGWDFSENFCEPVIDVMAERLSVTGFTLEDKGAQQSAGEADDQTELAQWLDSVAQRNRLDGKQRTLYSNALIKGRATARTNRTRWSGCRNGGTPGRWARV
jgi:SPX domain protein involved in polyphosphate accumulation